MISKFSWLSAAAVSAAFVFGASAAHAVTFTTAFDVTGIFSVDLDGDADNEVHEVVLAADARVTGIGWDIEIFADSPSWLSEAVVGFQDSDNQRWVNLTPGIGDDFSGTAPYSSGGVVDLVGLSLDFDVKSDGILRMEFFESFDDFADSWDARWLSGELTIEYETRGTAPVPEPSTWALMAIGFATLGVARRSRRSR